MRSFLCLVLSVVILTRIYFWTQKLDFTKGLCGQAALSFQTKKTFPLRIKGQAQQTFRGQIELIEPQVFEQNQWRAIEGKVFIPGSGFLKRSPNSWFMTEGDFDCVVSNKNFSALENGLFSKENYRFGLRRGFSGELEGEKTTLNFELASNFRSFLINFLTPFPWLSGIVWAVWTGEVSGLDIKLVELYRAGGLLPLIALSGQHVSVLVVMIRSLLTLTPKLLMEQRVFRKFFRTFIFLLPVFSCGLLALTSFSAPSVLRTLAMAMAFCLLRFRKKHCSTLQLLCSSSALVIVLDPSLICGISFVLSLGGCFLLLQIDPREDSPSSLRSYVTNSILMPILSAPLILFYFSQWGCLSPICTLGMSWLWNLVIIPIGFMTPFLGLLPSIFSVPVLKALDEGWRYLVEFQLRSGAQVERSLGVYLRPSAIEILVFGIGGVMFSRVIVKGSNQWLMQRKRLDALGFDFLRQKVSN